MFKIDIPGFVDSLNIMWKGILGIFIVTAVIVLVIVILNLATKKKKKSE